MVQADDLRQDGRQEGMVEMSLKDLIGDNLAAERPKSLAEQSADKLRELILLERLPAGLSLNERELSALLGISRTPVRDAIRLLEVEGLVDYIDGRLRVADPSMETLSHWLMIQGALEQSNVSPVLEVARLIEVQRAYEAGQSLIEREDDRISKFISTLRQF